MLLKLTLLAFVGLAFAQLDPRCPVTNTNPPTRLPSDTNCNVFYICHFGRLWVFLKKVLDVSQIFYIINHHCRLETHCPVGLQFDTPSLSCREPPVTCGPAPTQPPPTAPTDLPTVSTEIPTDPTDPTEPEGPSTAPELIPTVSIIIPSAPRQTTEGPGPDRRW